MSSSACDIFCNATRSFLRLWVSGAGLPVRETFLQIVDQPAACRPKTNSLSTNHMKRKGEPFALTDVQGFQPFGLNVFTNHVPRHVAPAEAAEKIVEAG